MKKLLICLSFLSRESERSEIPTEDATNLPWLLTDPTLRGFCALPEKTLSIFWAQAAAPGQIKGRQLSTFALGSRNGLGWGVTDLILPAPNHSGNQNQGLPKGGTPPKKN